MTVVKVQVPRRSARINRLPFSSRFVHTYRDVFYKVAVLEPGNLSGVVWGWYGFVSSHSSRVVLDVMAKCLMGQTAYRLSDLAADKQNDLYNLYKCQLAGLVAYSQKKSDRSAWLATKLRAKLHRAAAFDAAYAEALQHAPDLSNAASLHKATADELSNVKSGQQKLYVQLREKLVNNASASAVPSGGLNHPI